MSGVYRATIACFGVQRDTTDLISPPQPGWGAIRNREGGQGQGRGGRGLEQVVQPAQKFTVVSKIFLMPRSGRQAGGAPEAFCEFFARGSVAEPSMVGGIWRLGRVRQSANSAFSCSLVVSSLGSAAAAIPPTRKEFARDGGLEGSAACC